MNDWCILAHKLTGAWKTVLAVAGGAVLMLLVVLATRAMGVGPGSRASAETTPALKAVQQDVSASAPVRVEVTKEVTREVTTVVTKVVEVPVTTTSVPASPTPSVLPATPTPVPTNTPIPNTPPGTLLKPGESWYQDGVRVTVSDPLWTGLGCQGGPWFSIRIENLTGQELPAQVDTNQWYALDDAGHKHPLGLADGVCVGWSVFVLPPGTLPFGQGYVKSEGPHLGVKTDPRALVSLNTLRIVIPQLARVKNAAWVIPVPH